MRHPAPSSCRTDPTLLVLENKMIEAENSTEDGTSATKDLINVALIIRRVRLHNQQYCVPDAGANVSNTWPQSVMVGLVPYLPGSQTRPGMRCGRNGTTARAMRVHGSLVGLTNGSCCRL